MGLGLGLLAGPALDFLGNMVGAQIEEKQQDQSRSDAKDQFSKNIELQKEFAQQGIRWRVEDAVAAGLHPLAALGAGGASYSPQGQVVGSSGAVGDLVSRAGQSIGRAISSTSTSEERQLQKVQLAMAQAQLDGQLIENQYRASKLRTEFGSPASGPPTPTLMGGNNIKARVVVQPKKVTASHPGQPQFEAGASPDVARVRTKDGLYNVMPQDVAESYESDHMGALMWQLRNNILPNIWYPARKWTMPKSSDLPKGYDYWDYSPLMGWVPRKDTWREDWKSQPNPYKRKPYQGPVVPLGPKY